MEEGEVRVRKKRHRDMGVRNREGKERERVISKGTTVTLSDEGGRSIYVY